MNLTTAMTMLRDHYPREDFPDRSIAAYAERLSGIPEGVVLAAVKNLVMRCKWRPTVGEIATECAELALGLPSEEQAWEIAERGSLRDAHPAVQKAAEHVGGRWAVLHSDNPTTVRAQFRDAYRNLRARAIDEYRTGAPRALPPGLAELMGPTMAALPETTHFRPRPVMSRLVRRWAGRELEPPTEEEKVDATTVLHEGPSTDDPKDDPLYVEAERIFAEAGV